MLVCVEGKEQLIGKGNVKRVQYTSRESIRDKDLGKIVKVIQTRRVSDMRTEKERVTRQDETNKDARFLHRPCR